MKFSLVSNLVFSAVFAVYAEVIVDIGCTKDTSINCRDAIRSVASDKLALETFYKPDVILKTDNPDHVTANFLGSCTKAIEIVKNAPACNVKECSAAQCEVTYSRSQRLLMMYHMLHTNDSCSSVCAF